MEDVEATAYSVEAVAIIPASGLFSFSSAVAVALPSQITADADVVTMDPEIIPVSGSFSFFSSVAMAVDAATNLQ